MTKNQKKISRKGKGSGLAIQRFRLHKSKDEFNTIVSFTFIAMLLISSIALSAININAYAQTPKVNHTGKESEKNTAKDNSTHDGKSSGEEEGDRPINTQDAVQKESTTDSLEENSDVDGTQLMKSDRLQVDLRGNTAISQETDYTISLLK
ncbi:MAG TPA: hypothetical protein VD815_06865 [Candidatus Saccharimonadales bacterium]|nr:hypothetical protein [Candidatus Saccharimonadales bacterium]